MILPSSIWHPLGPPRPPWCAPGRRSSPAGHPCSLVQCPRLTCGGYALLFVLPGSLRIDLFQYAQIRGRGRGEPDRIRELQVWRLFSGALATFGDFHRVWRLASGSKKSPKDGRAPERAGGGAERPRMAQIGAQIRGSGQPARRPFRCQGGCLEEAPNGAAASSRASRGTS